MKRDAQLSEIIRREINDELAFLDALPSCRQTVLRRITQEAPVRKRISTGALLVALLVFLTITGLAASAFRSLLFLDHEAYGAPYACCTDGEKLYVLSQNGLWVYHAGQEQAQQIVSARNLPRFRSLLHVKLVAAEELLLIDTDAQQIWKQQGDIFKSLPSYAGTLLDDADEHASAILWQDGMLFVQSDHEGSVYRIDAKTYTGAKLPAENVTRIANYQPGKLLALTYTPQQGTSVVIINIEDGAQQALYRTPSADVKGISYATLENAVYAFVSGTLSRWNGVEWSPVSSAALPHLPFFMGIFGHTYAAASHDGIQFMPLDTLPETETLVIHGLFDSVSYDHSFQQAFPGVNIARKSELTFDIEAAVQALQAGSAADLLHVRITSAEVDALWNLAEPIVSEALHADAGSMLPVLQSVLFRDGSLYGVPSSIVAEAWKTESNASPSVPSTLLRLLNNAHYRIGEKTFEGTQEVTRLWQTKDYAVWLLKQALRERNAGTLRFTDAAFVDTLKALCSFDASATETNSDIWYHACVELAGYLHPEGAIPYTIPPRIAHSDSIQIPAYFTVYLLNPASCRKETAIRYLEYVAANRPAWDEALLKPDTAQPVPNDWAQRFDSAEAAANPENWDVFDANLCFYRKQIAPHIVIDDIQQCNKSEEPLLQVLLDCLDGKMSPQECALLLEQLAE